MIKKKLFIDMDNTLCDLSERFCEKFYEFYGTKLDRNYPSYGILDQTNFCADQRKDAYNKIFSSKDFWILINPFEGIEVLKELNDKFEVFILTKPWVSASANCIPEKIQWLEIHLPFININKQFITMENKPLLSTKDRILVDDNPEYLDNWSGITIKYNQPYNQDTLTMYEGDSWKEIYKVLKYLV